MYREYYAAVNDNKKIEKMFIPTELIEDMAVNLAKKTLGEK